MASGFFMTFRTKLMIKHIIINDRLDFLFVKKVKQYISSCYSEIRCQTSFCVRYISNPTGVLSDNISFGPRQANLVLIVYASSEGSGEPPHPRSLTRTFAVRSYKQ